MSKLRDDLANLELTIDELQVDLYHYNQDITDTIQALKHSIALIRRRLDAKPR